MVSCQLARLRLLPTAHTMKAPLDTGGRKTTEVSPVQTAANESVCVKDVFQDTAERVCLITVGPAGSNSLASGFESRRTRTHTHHLFLTPRPRDLLVVQRSRKPWFVMNRGTMPPVP